MNISCKRAVGLAFLFYVSTFVVALICGTVTGADMSTMENIPDSFWYLGMLFGAILSALFTLWYFRGGKVAATPRSGFLFGVVAVVLSSLLDLILLSLGNAGGANVDLMTYYGDIRYWIIPVLVILAATIVGHAKQKKAS